jgi:ABC-type multidrug transport system ATPase subunit
VINPMPPVGSFATEPHRQHDIVLCFDGVTITRGKRTLLDKASGIVRGGRLTALVSTCGGRGDYHLLNVLAAQHDGGGLVIAHGTLAKTNAFRQHCALIDEEMTVLDHLTVRQNLMYGSEMRAQASFSDHAARLATVVRWMKLEPHLRRQVLSCSYYVRRRVSIARELMLHPAAVFVDSATEGLATHEARELLALLRHVAVQTRSVLAVSMLQPRWTLLELVDDVIALEGPSIVFSGTSYGFLVAASRTTAQRMTTSSDDRREASSESLVEAPESAINAVYRIASNPQLHLLRTAPAFVASLEERSAQVTDRARLFVEGQLPLLSTPFPRVQPWMTWKFVLLCKYGTLQLWNRVLVHIASAVLVLLAAILVGVVYQRQDEDGQAGMQNRTGIIFFLISSTFLHSLLFVESSKRSYVSFQRHRVHGYFDCVTYLVYWLTTSALYRLIGCIVFMAVVYALAHVHSTIDLTSLQSLVGIMAMTSFTSAILVWLVCSALPTTRYAQFVLFGIYAFNTILAGIVLNVNTLPPFFQDISYASLIRLGYESAIASEFNNKTFGCHQETSPPQGSPAIGNETYAPPAMLTRCFTGDGYMRFLGFSSSRETSNMAVMAYIALGLSIISLCFMWLGKAR